MKPSLSTGSILKLNICSCLFFLGLVILFSSCRENKKAVSDAVVSEGKKARANDTMAATKNKIAFEAASLHKNEIISKQFNAIKFPWNEYTKLYQTLKEKSFFVFQEYSDNSDDPEILICYALDKDYKKTAGPVFLNNAGLSREPTVFDQDFIRSSLILTKEEIDADRRFGKFNFLSLRPALRISEELGLNYLTYGVHFDDLNSPNVLYLNPCPPGHPPLNFQ